MSISPYPDNVSVKGNNVFKNGRYLGYVDKVQNWGADFLARVEGNDKLNKFFATKTQAVFYLAEVSTAPKLIFTFNQPTKEIGA